MSKCQCSMAVRVLGDGCRYCQPQEYIDNLEQWLYEEREQLAAVTAELDKERALNDKLVESYEKADFEIRKLKADREQMEKQEPYTVITERIRGMLVPVKLYAHPPVPDGKVLVPVDPLMVLQYQTQCDEDGTLIAVSRQAVDELLKAAQGE